LDVATGADRHSWPNPCPKCASTLAPRAISCEVCGIDVERYRTAAARVKELEARLGRRTGVEAPGPGPVETVPGRPQSTAAQQSEPVPPQRMSAAFGSATGFHPDSNASVADDRDPVAFNQEGGRSVWRTVGTLVAWAMGVLAGMLSVAADAKDGPLGGMFWSVLAGSLLATLLLLPGLVCALALAWRVNRNRRRMHQVYNWATGILSVMLCVSALGRLDGSSVGSVSQAMAATAYIEVPVKGGVASGSGFLAAHAGASDLVVTNAHVVLDNDRLPSRIDVFFASGSRHAEHLRAEVAAIDRANDLAVLRLPRLKGNLQPIRPNTSTEVAAAQDILVLGFPFGGELSMATDTPDVTISKGIVSSVRRDMSDDPGVIQVDADINPGSSGGPVVDPHGHLIGVARAKVKTTQIGFAIPVPVMQRALYGTIGDFQLAKVRGEWSLEAVRIDPLDRIHAARLRVLPDEDILRDVNSLSGFWNSVGASEREIEMKPDGRRSGRLVADLSSLAGGREASWLLQPEITADDGTTRFLPPIWVQFDRQAQLVGFDGNGILLQDDDEPTQVAGADESPRLPPPKGPPPDRNRDQVVTARGGSRIDALQADEPDTKVYSFASQILDVAIGGDGRYLVVNQKGVVGFDVIDLNKGETHHVDTPMADTVITANRDWVYAGSADLNMLMSWRLSTLKPGASVAAPGTGRFRTFAVGGATRAAPLLVMTTNGIFLVDSETLFELKDIEWTKAPNSPDIRMLLNAGDVELRAAADAPVYTWWRRNVSPTGLFMVRLQGDTAWTYYEHKSGGYLAPVPDGNLILTRQIGIVGAELQTASAESWSARELHATSSPALLLEAIDKGTSVQFFGGPGRLPVGIKVSTPEMSWPKQVQDPRAVRLTDDKRFYYDLEHQRLITIPDSDDSIVVRPLQLPFRAS